MKITTYTNLIGQSLLVTSLFCIQTSIIAHELPISENSDPAIAQYIANTGVMVSDGDMKVVFDPLFNNVYGQYQPVPKQTKSALLNGRAPFNNIDAIMISHHHGDHFDAKDILTLLRNCEQVNVYAPAQAVAAMEAIAAESDTHLFERVTALDINYKDAPQTIELGHLLIEVAHIPHSGWPTRHQTVQNLSFRVTMNNRVTVTHMGDADIDPAHYLIEDEYWGSRHTDVAFPPYWYLQSKEGRRILTENIHASSSIGVHVPEKVAKENSKRPTDYRDLEIFTTPGETREITTNK